MVSVSSQSDSQQALIAKEKAELAELAELYEAKSLSPGTAHQVAVELTEHDALSRRRTARAGDGARGRRRCARPGRDLRRRLPARHDGDGVSTVSAR